MSSFERPESPQWQLLCDTGALVSECPIWVDNEQSLYWIDMYGASLNCTIASSGATRSWSLPERVGSFALRAGGALLALRSGLLDLDFADGQLSQRAAAPYDPRSYYFNDGRCDRTGRFWAGTSRAPESTTAAPGAFYRVDENGAECRFDGFATANGIAFSPDGCTMYTADTPGNVIYAYDFDGGAGEASARRVFARLGLGQYPDGAAVDSEGGYWIALVGSGRVVRFTPKGVLDRVLEAPSRFPTMIAFGGLGLRTMFLTSSRKYLDRLTQAEREREKHAGAVWRCELDARGLPEPWLAF